ncbi:unnamed protein product [Prorocentrum cordatum]|uniref:Calx-beta domain-containing protein n=1 Tax=Prorocentrum cordatum TaxID=2364126 RepID=A0ABN9UN19_9DINO|nr:unnamed protein product [Polarella glacialis]
MSHWIFSLFAYFWLWFIVVVSTPDVVDPWEAGLALAMFPVLVFVSWLTDKGYMPFMAMDPAPSSEDDTEHILKKHPRVRFSQMHLTITQEFEVGNRKTVQRWKEAIADDPLSVDDTIWPYLDNGKGIEDGTGKLIDNAYGILAFRSDTENTVSRLDHRHSFTIDVLRRNGTKGTVTCEYRTESLSAIPSQDFVGKKGQLKFNPGEDKHTITVEILGKRIGEPEDEFQLVLSDIKTDNMSSVHGAHFNPHDDGGREKALCTITIANGNEGQLDGCLEKLGALSERWFLDRANLQMGLEAWSEQIRLACSIDPEVGDDDAEDVESSDIPGPMDYLMHTMSLPWKVLFAVLCPPSNWCGGWLLFGMALLYIAACTAVVIDLASFFGCCADIPEEVTAVTIVALGTSLPDMFASITSAQEDDHADASIVNVTGSNSVNVFLGIGLPWTVSSVLWSSVWGATDKWKRTYSNTDLPGKYPGGAFVVQAGSLGFSVLIFFFLAAMCVVVLRIRRIRYRGELGGPTLSKNASSCFLFGLWAIYITTTIWKSSAGSTSDLPLFLVMGACICTLVAGAIVEVQNKISPRDPIVGTAPEEDLTSGQPEGDYAPKPKSAYERLEEGSFAPGAASPGRAAPSDASTQDGATSASGLSRRSQLPEPPLPSPAGAAQAPASVCGSVASGAAEGDAAPAAPAAARDAGESRKRKKRLPAPDTPESRLEAAADAVGAAAAATASPQTYGRGRSDAGLGRGMSDAELSSGTLVSASSGDVVKKRRPRDPSKPPRDPNKPRKEKKDREGP